MKKNTFVVIIVIVAIIAAIIGGVMVWKNNNEVVDTPVVDEPVIEVPADDEVVADVPVEQPNDSQEPVEDSNTETPDAEEANATPDNEVSEEPENSDTVTDTTDETASTDEPTNDGSQESVNEEANTTENVPSEPTPVVHTHKYGNWVSNGNGTHTKTCSATEGECDATSITEKCSNDPCGKCGYTVPHTHNYTYTSNGDGTHTATCTSTTGSCTAKTYTENCSNGTCNKCGYTKPQATVDIIATDWTGTGVNTTIEWDFEDPLTNMPNTANVIEKYGSGYSGGGNTFTAAGVGVANNIDNGIWIKGFRFTNIDKAAYETAIAMLKDLLDSESATAVVNWLEKADDLGHEVYELEIAGKDASAAQSTWLDYLATAEDQPIKLGNVTLQLEWAGFYNIYIRNN